MKLNRALGSDDAHDIASSNGPTSEVMSSTSKEVYSPEEVASLLGLHPNSVYTLLKTGELPGMKAGRKWLISKRRFDGWLHGGSEE